MVLRHVGSTTALVMAVGFSKVGKMDLCMGLGPKVGVLPSFVAKIVGNDYCTDTSVQPVTVGCEYTVLQSKSVDFLNF